MSIGEWVSWSKFVDCEIWMTPRMLIVRSGWHQECWLWDPFKTLFRTLLEGFLFLLSVEDKQVSDLVDSYQWDDASDLIHVDWYQWDDASDLIHVDWYQWDNASDLIHVDWYQWDNASDLIHVDWYQWDDCNCHIYLFVTLPGLLVAQCDCNLEKGDCLLPYCCTRQVEVR